MILRESSRHWTRWLSGQVTYTSEIFLGGVMALLCEVEDEIGDLDVALWGRQVEDGVSGIRSYVHKQIGAFAS